MCYPVKFGSSAPKDVCINRREPPKLGSAGSPPLAIGAYGWPLEIRSSPHVCYPAKFGRSRSNGTSVIKEIRLKIWPLASRLSRSLKVIRTDSDRSATIDFLLTFHINHGPISYRFRDKQRFQSKIRKLSHPHILRPRWWGSPWNW